MGHCKLVVDCFFFPKPEYYYYSVHCNFWCFYSLNKKTTLRLCYFIDTSDVVVLRIMIITHKLPTFQVKRDCKKEAGEEELIKKNL